MDCTAAYRYLIDPITSSRFETTRRRRTEVRRRCRGGLSTAPAGRWARLSARSRRRSGGRRDRRARRRHSASERAR